MNMWVCEIGGGILGYAQFPGGSASTDGVVANPTCFGSQGAVNAPFNLGRTMTHEVGHYLNLRHIWGDGACSASDYVNDTPSASAANYGCPSYPSSSCSSNDMTMNFMDYTDDQCMYMFSEGQSARMWACLNSSRANLGTSGGNLEPVANVNGAYNGNAGSNIYFSSNGSNDPDGTIASYAWNFGDGSTSSQANPSHSYSSDGTYTVTLTVTDNNGATASASTTCQIGTPSCVGVEATSNITLRITTDNYGSETSWTLKNASGATVESGSGYGNNTSYTFDWNLSEGAYTFTINDSYGDGMCCSYGNGSYALKNGSTTLVSGGAIGSSESTDLCVAGGSTPPANSAPVADANGPYSANEGSSISFSGSATDADGDALTYSWNFGDGSTGSGASATHTYASAGSYTVQLTVTDGNGGSDTDNASVTISAVSNPGGSTVLEENYFETGWDNWTDGGGDCYRYSGSRSYEGNYSIRLRDNTSTSSSMTSQSHDLTSFNQVTIEFYFYSYSMESGEDFFVKYYDGSSWKTLAAYASGTNFNNNTFYSASVTMSRADYSFVSNGKFRFQCDASTNSDHIYIDQVTITASNSARISNASVKQIGNSMETARANDFDDLAEISLYPNPATDVMTIAYSIDDNSIAYIYSINGSLVKTIKLTEDNTVVDVQNLRAGMYLLKVVSSEEVNVQRFVKK